MGADDSRRGAGVKPEHPQSPSGKGYRLDDFCAFEIIPGFGNHLRWFCAWRKVSNVIGYPIGYRERT
jgi:hypothetical protein